MELLFTDATGNVELKELLGFLDLSIPYKNIKSKIITATNDVVNLIGQATYDLAVIEYKKPDAKDEVFLFNIRQAIAIQAYRKYAPHNDLAHTSEGRLNRLEENQKSPFQWMIDKDNSALERSYYEALDNLIKFLDANIPSWKLTEEYKATHGLFIQTASDFDQYFPIGNSRLIMLKLAPGIRLCENNQIKSRIGKTLFDALKLDASQQPELVHKIQEATAYYSLAWAMRRMSVQLFPEGVLQGFKSEKINASATKGAENNEAYSVAAYFEIDANKAFLEIESIITEINKPANTVVEPLTFKADENNKFISM